MTADAGRIDVQFHFSPPFYTEMVAATRQYVTTNQWGVSAALDYMGRYDVATGVLSVSTPGVDFLGKSESVALARRLNEAAATVVQERPARFGTFATLPMQDIAATLEEIEFCFDTLEVDGVCMMSNTLGIYPGDPAFDEIFDELNRRKAVIFIHPTNPGALDPLKMGPYVVEWLFDTTRAALNLVYSGTIRRCPDLKIILAHAGGTVPIVQRRLVEMAPMFSRATPKVTLEEASAHFANFYYDLAISAHENTIGALRAMSSLDHVLFACDWPFAPDFAVQMNVDGFKALSLSEQELAAIERGNAMRLFPRLMRYN